MRRVAALLAVLGLAACGPAAAGDGTQPGAVEPYVSSVDLCGQLPNGMPKLPARQSLSPPPIDVRVTWVLECAQGPPAPSGAAKTQIVRRADGPGADLLAALRLPSATKVSSACTLEYLLPFYLALITTDGHAIAPAIPVDGCHKPRQEVLAALGKLPFRPVG
jgi:hypothetical protein